MDRDYQYIPPGARAPTTPGSPTSTRQAPWPPPAHDRRTAPRPLTHTQSSPPHPPSSRTGYVYRNVGSSAMADPFQSHEQSWSPPRPVTQTSNGNSNYRHPNLSVNVNQPPESWQFPEPQLTRSISHQASLQPPQTQHHRPRAHSSIGVHPAMGTSVSSPNLNHKYSYSDGHDATLWQAEGDINDTFGRSPSLSPSQLSEEFAHATIGGLADDGLASANGLERFQNGEGEDNDWAWHLLVTKEARESLPPPEVMRQSAIFGLINGERSYVNDMKLVQEIFIDGLRRASPPVVSPERLEGFVSELFYNIDCLLAHHQRMLDALFDLQRVQHPILLSVGDIVLDTVLKFQSGYESYIKHYPLAESLHRRERKSNPRYRAFLQRCSQDSRLGKRDLITFISRPVTRLPRLSLQLAEVKKRTEKLGDSEGGGGQVANKADYPDLETIPIVVDVLDRFVKSTQPGIAASEGKVKFYALCESLKFRKGEIIDMDLYHENRTLVHSGPLARKQRSDTWHGWTDLEIGLLDNYVVITKPDARIGTKDVVSRPIPLEYLRLGPFNGLPESRREERSEGGGILETIIKHTRPMFPFVIYHASSPARRYTLYANSEGARRKWMDAFVDALGVRKVVTDANKWFAMNSINDGFFRLRTPLVPGTSPGPFTGMLTSAVTFLRGGKSIVAVGTPTGVYVGVRGQVGAYTKVLALPSITYMSALQGFNKLLILHSGNLLAYSLDLVARVGQGHASLEVLDASLERLARNDRHATVSFFRVGVVAGKTLVVYACKSFLSFTLNVLEVVAEPSNNVPQKTPSRSFTFRPYGETFYVPKEPFDVTLLVKTIAVSTDRLMIVVDPTNLAGQAPVPIPDFSQDDYDDLYDSPMAALKAKCDSAKPIGMVRCGKEELLVIYDEFGCYVTKHAVPTRKCGYVRWETRATAYAERGMHILLFSTGFIEIRHTPTGRLMQVVEGKNIRLLQSQVDAPLLVAVRGKKDDKQGLSDELIELVETAPLGRPRLSPGARSSSGPHVNSNSLWDEWD